MVPETCLQLRPFRVTKALPQNGNNAFKNKFWVPCSKKIPKSHCRPFVFKTRLLFRLLIALLSLLLRWITGDSLGNRGFPNLINRKHADSLYITFLYTFLTVLLERTCLHIARGNFTWYLYLKFLWPLCRPDLIDWSNDSMERLEIPHSDLGLYSIWF